MSDDDSLGSVDWISEKCKERWNESIKKLGPDFEEFLQTFLSEFGWILKSSTGFKIRLVIDTNAVITEVLRLLKGRKPFLLELIKSPFLELLAPPEIVDELNEHLPKVISDTSNRTKGFELAQTIIDSVSLVESSDSFSRIRAESLMGVKDPDDVVFVQIALEYSTHGVLTSDKHFMNLGEIKKWELGKVGRVVTELNRGALTLWIAARGIPAATLILIQVGMAIVSFAFAGLSRVADIVSSGGKKLIDWIVASAKNNPLATAIALGLVAASLFGLALWEPPRKWIDEQLEALGAKLDDTISAAAALIDRMMESINILVNACVEQLPALAEWVECLGASSALLMKRFEELERL